jgi:hypothetical protein
MEALVAERLGTDFAEIAYDPNAPKEIEYNAEPYVPEVAHT